MEPILSLKRQNEPDPTQCIICQDDKTDKLLKASVQGWLTVKKSALLRLKHRDAKCRAAIDRITSVYHAEEEQSTVWHRTCYASFTSSEKIGYLQKKAESSISSSEDTGTTLPPLHDKKSSRLRSSTEPMDWEACLFCQEINLKQTLSTITTFKMSQQIIEAAQYDKFLIVHLAGVNDLIASGGKYHGTCYKRFIRKTSNTRDKINITDVPMQWLIDELRCTAEQAFVLEFSEVWNRYTHLADRAGIEVPQSFISRRSSFKEKLEQKVSDRYEFITMSEKTVEGQKIVLVPIKFRHVPISRLSAEHDEHDEPSLIPPYQPTGDSFLEMVHVALKLRSDILAHPPYHGFNVSEQDAISCIPETLYMFIRLLMGGQRLFEDDPDDKEELDATHHESRMQDVTLSIAQDLVYNVTGGKHWTPKHIGLASTLHQATRSKELVQLFHNAGHIISYDNVLQVDNALAENTLKSMDPKTGAVTPPNFVHGRFVHFTCDNIDINDTSFDGQNGFHATQVAAWQRGPESDLGLADLVPSKNTTCHVPEVMEEVFPAAVVTGMVEPVLKPKKQMVYSAATEAHPEILKAKATDMAFFISRNDDKAGEGLSNWTHFNQVNSKVNPNVTTIGYMPIIQSPAHELDTLNTVVLRCRHVATMLGQKHVVLTVDEALYCKLMELKWVKEEYQEFLVVRLGGLHIALNFLKIIGKHMESSGLLDAWIESKLMGPKAAEQALAGKSYSRGIRAHKITAQAMWRILMPNVLNYLGQRDNQIIKDIENATASGDMDRLIVLLDTNEFRESMEAFIASKSNVNFEFWWGYLTMVQILLKFIRAQRDGIWQLHVNAFQCMLPLFMRYDHTNYARWGTIYVMEMHELPSEVYAAFENGDFVVKRSTMKFNQVDPDQSQEWLNGIGKKRGGIVGITKTSTALSRWALSYNLRSHIGCETRKMYHLGNEDSLVHVESTKGRRSKDNQDEELLFKTLLAFNLFSDEAPSSLQNIATKDIATKQIADNLLNATVKGQEQLTLFVEQRLLPCEENKVTFRDPLHKNNPLTFSSMFDKGTKSNKAGKEKALKGDRLVLQRLITAYESGRKVNLNEILCHELLNVPIALAEMNGNLRTGSKAILSQLLTADTACPASLSRAEIGDNATLIIDGQALVVAIGKPQGASTFGDLSETFVKSVLLGGALFHRIDIIFDRYYVGSIKQGTRNRRAQGSQAIRRIIENRDVPLPTNWKNFLALEENKTDLARFLSGELIAQAPYSKCIVVSGGFDEETKVQSSSPNVDKAKLVAKHEEADTRIIVHCIQNQSDNIVVHARDTDVLLLLIAHFHRMPCTKVWLKAGTAKNRKYIPVHEIVEHLPYDETILAFHALSGSDTTSYFAGHSKKTTWKVFEKHHELLKNLGRGDLTSETIQDAERFICRLYGLQNIDKVDEARPLLFVRSPTPESLPPTSDALLFHIKRSHYQAKVWRLAHLNFPDLPRPTSMGWICKDDVLVPLLMSLPPVPESCREIISCGCNTKCSSLRCKCKKAQLPCTAACKCREASDSCHND